MAEPIEAAFMEVRPSERRATEPADPDTQARINALAVRTKLASLPRRAKVAAIPREGKEWEKQPGESAQGYAAFVLYRALPPGTRSLNLLARQTGKSLSNFHRFSQKYHWIMRVNAWDEYLARQREDAERDALIREALQFRQSQQTVVKEQLVAAQSLKGQALRVIERESEKTKQQGGPDVKVLELASRTLERAVEMERMAVGLPTDVTQQSVQLKKEVAEAFEITDAIKGIIAEQLCNECKARVTNEIRRLARRQRAVTDRLAI